jgi:hypothetical protein
LRMLEWGFLIRKVVSVPNMWLENENYIIIWTFKSRDGLMWHWKYLESSKLWKRLETYVALHVAIREQCRSFWGNPNMVRPAKPSLEEVSAKESCDRTDWDHLPSPSSCSAAQKSLDLPTFPLERIRQRTLAYFFFMTILGHSVKWWRKECQHNTNQTFAISNNT